MIIREFYRTLKDGRNLVRTYSTEGMKIKKVGTNETYDEAIDLEEMAFDYTEITEEEYEAIMLKQQQEQELEASIQ